jgi:hypothetical protein
MCVNCLSQAETLAAHTALAVAVLKEPAHRLLAELGVVDDPMAVARDAHTVSFLRSLDLDAEEVLGREVVATADQWVAAGQPRPARSRLLARASAAPIGSQSTIALP